MAKIVTLKNNNDEEVYPITTAEAVNGGLYADNGIEVTGVVPDVTTSRIVDGAVTSAKIDWTTLYIKGADLSGDKAFNSGYTEIQTITLPAGKWLVFWGVRAYFGTNDIGMVTVGLSQNGNVVQSVITNYNIYQSTARFMQSSICEVTLTGTGNYTSFINAPASGSVSATPSYLFALRVG